MDKLLTIVIPTYNMQDYLSRGLDSLIVQDEQLMNQLEVLVINDGSTDRSSEIAHGYEAKYPHTFRVIDKENGHYGSCVNRGLKEATGKYIKILDADDWFDTKNFAEFIRFLAIYDVDLIVSDYVTVSEGGKQYITRYNIPAGVWKLNEVDSVCDMRMHATTYRRAIFEGLNYHQTEGISYTDEEWIFLPMTKVNNLAGFPHVVYEYFVGREGQTINPMVYARNIAQEIQSWKVQQEVWNTSAQRGYGDAKEYLWQRLKKRAIYIEANMILNYRYGHKKEMLIAFDTFIKEYNPRLYEEMEAVTSCEGLSFRYIHYWRKWKNRPFVAFIKKVESTIMRKFLGK